MADNISRYSPEDITKTRKLLSEAKSLLAREEEIVEKVLKGEEVIGKTRVGYLKEYIGLYEKLDEAIARKTSELTDGFLILERKTAESFAAATSEIEKAKKAIEAAGKGRKDNNGNNNNGGSSSGANSASGGGGDKLDTTYDMISGDDRRDTATSQEDFADRTAAFLKKYRTEEERLLAIILEKEDAQLKLADIEERRSKRREESYERQEKLVESIKKSEIELYLMREKDAEEQKNLLTELRLSRQQETLTAETVAQKHINDIITETIYFGQHSEEAGEFRAREVNAQEDEKSATEFEKQRAEYRAALEYKAKKKYNGKLDREQQAEIERQVAEKYALEQENLDKLTKERFKKEQAERAKLNRKIVDDAVTGPLNKENNLKERLKSLNELTKDDDKVTQAMNRVAAGIVAISTLAQQLEKKMDEIAGYKGAIDTRLQGSSNETVSGSYWDQLVKDMTSVGAINPYFKQEDFANNIKSLVDTGIAFDLEQRAFLMTIKDKIATTFNVADASLLRLIRIQQEDTTAGRLGMESALNSFLNNMYENTEYLKQVASGVRTSLEEMQALMTGAAATEVEYQVQKWLGSLYSVGMSQEATNSIATALGQIAAGQIEGLTNGGAGNLLIMAANDAGVPIADILTKGITADETNQLLQAAVNYLAELADSSKDSRVVQQQLANVFGVKASDLQAATNLVGPGTTTNIYKNSLSYGGMLEQLMAMAGTMGDRTSLAEKMSNIWTNGQYTLAGSIASTPAAYMIYKVATLLDNTVGGIPIPAISTMFGGVDLETTVADLMRVAAVGTGIIGSLGPILSGLGNSFSGQKMLNEMGINANSGLMITPRGDGSNLVGSTGGGKQTTSESGYAGNSSGSDIINSTQQEAEDSKKQLMIEAKEEEGASEIDVLNTTVLKIYELLDEVASGKSSFNVRVEGYGLTKAGNGRSAQGGVRALSQGNSVLGGGVNSTSVSGNIDFGSWTTTV